MQTRRFKYSGDMRNFKFDRRWIGQKGFQDTIKEAWKAASLDQDVSLFDKIQESRRAISRWKRRHPSNNAKLIEELQLELERAPQINPWTFDCAI